MSEYLVIDENTDVTGPFSTLNVALSQAAEATDAAAANLVGEHYVTIDGRTTVSIAEVVLRWRLREYFHPDGSPGITFAPDNIATEADRLRAALAECREWLARFENDSEAYQLGVEAGRKGALAAREAVEGGGL